MAKMSKITPCLWFDSRAEEAAEHYVSIFDHSGIDTISRYCKAGFEHHGRPEGSVMTVQFHLEDQPFMALNGGPLFQFSEAISFQVGCETQAEIDRLWSRLTEGGAEGRCGWLKDKFGLSWQIVPTALFRLMSVPAKAAAVTRAFMPMTKLDIATLERAYREA